MKIRIDNVSKVIKKIKVLDQVSLEFESGSITGLKGINGSGKTPGGFLLGRGCCACEYHPEEKHVWGGIL